MSEQEAAELVTFRELEGLVHHLVEELASFRRRALRAEARLKDLENAGNGDASAGSLERINELEQENETLRSRLDGARGRTEQILARVHFLRQQAQGGDA